MVWFHSTGFHLSICSYGEISVFVLYSFEGTGQSAAVDNLSVIHRVGGSLYFDTFSLHFKLNLEGEWV